MYRNAMGKHAMGKQECNGYTGMQWVNSNAKGKQKSNG